MMKLNVIYLLKRNVFNLDLLRSSHVTFVVGQNIIQVKMISTEFDSQFPLSLSPSYSLHFLPTTHMCNPRGHQELFKTACKP